VDRAALSEKAAAKDLHDPIGLHQDAPESIGVFRVVASMLLVPVEANRVGHLIRLDRDPHGKIEPLHLRHQLGVEARDRLRPQRQPAGPAVARLYD
jgi:hypothetical protein